MGVKKLSHQKVLDVHYHPELTANALDLVYITDSTIGILRKKKGKGFSYIFKGAPVKEKIILNRIKTLAIPPAWSNVWICYHENGHLQATGIDARQRKQYRYHTLWTFLRNETKFHHLLEFGKALPKLRLQAEKDIADQNTSASKVLATVISLMERTYIRIGNLSYAKENGSFGLTTLKDKHVSINGDQLHFSFAGKKGVHHQISLKNTKLAKAVKDCRSIPGQSLFQYLDEHNERKTIDSGMVNNYIKEATGGQFTAKDFRTWAGSLHLLHAFAAMERAIDEKARNANVVKALEQVSRKLGNTRAVCRKYYVHPGLIDLYEKDQLHQYLEQLNLIEKDDGITGLTQSEKTLLNLLENMGKHGIKLKNIEGGNSFDIRAN